MSEPVLEIVKVLWRGQFRQLVADSQRSFKLHRHPHEGGSALDQNRFCLRVENFLCSSEAPLSPVAKVFW